MQLSQERSGNFLNLVRPQELSFEVMKNYPNVSTSYDTENPTHILWENIQLYFQSTTAFK